MAKKKLLLKYDVEKYQQRGLSFNIDSHSLFSSLDISRAEFCVSVSYAAVSGLTTAESVDAKRLVQNCPENGVFFLTVEQTEVC
jgi:hypothetical protein